MDWIDNLSFNEFKTYYESHSRGETMEYFNLKRWQITAFCKLNNYKKPIKQVVAQRSKNNLEKYGVENVFQLESVKNKCNTEETILKANKSRQKNLIKLKENGQYFSLLEHNKCKRLETIITKYGSVENYNNQSNQKAIETSMKNMVFQIIINCLRLINIIERLLNLIMSILILLGSSRCTNMQFSTTKI